TIRGPSLLPGHRQPFANGSRAVARLNSCGVTTTRSRRAKTSCRRISPPPWPTATPWTRKPPSPSPSKLYRHPGYPDDLMTAEPTTPSQAPGLSPSPSAPAPSPGADSPTAPPTREKTAIPRNPGRRDLGMKATLLFPDRDIVDRFYVPLIYTACRTCYSELEPDEIFRRAVAGEVDPARQQKLIQGVIESGHGSTIEHIVFTFGISGVSRTLSHQLVRHRAGVAFEIGRASCRESGAGPTDGVVDVIESSCS